MSEGGTHPIPRVFISYAQYDPAHAARVLELAYALEADGLAVELDQFHGQELIDWPRWCAERLDPKNTGFVLMVCSAEYRRRIEGHVELDVGRGVFWEGHLIYGYLYEDKANVRFVPLLLDDEPESSLPRIVVTWNGFRLRRFGVETGDEGYKNLYRLLTGQPATPRPSRGTLKRLPPRPVPSPQRAAPAVKPVNLPDPSLGTTGRHPHGPHQILPTTECSIGQTEDSKEGFLLSPRLRFAYGDPFEHFSQVCKVLRDNDNLLGPERVIPQVREQIEILPKLSDSMRGIDRQRLLQVQAQFADLYAWLYQDTCNHHEAQCWLGRALDWSQMTDDSEAIDFISARKSQVAGESNESTDAIGIAQAAIRHAHSSHWRAVAIAAVYGAHGYALQGNESACKHMYDKAYNFLAKIEPDPNTTYGLFLNTAYIDVQRAHSLAALGENALAAEAFEKAINTLPVGYHRDRGIYLVRKALAHAEAEEAEQAVATGWQALIIGAETKSVRIINGLAQLHKALSRWNAVPCVTDFCRTLIDIVVPIEM